MASFGAKNPYFCKVKEEPDGKLPVYDGEPVKIGRLVKADLSITMASGKLYADDELAESVEEFASGSLTMETDDIIDSVASVVYGTTVEEKTVHYNTKDDPPSGGLAYYKKLMRKRKVLYKGVFHPLVKASLGNDSASTKTDSITFGTSTTNFTVSNANNGDWRFTEEFETEDAALAWVKAMLGFKAEELTPAAAAPKPSAGEKVGV